MTALLVLAVALVAGGVGVLIGRRMARFDESEIRALHRYRIASQTAHRWLARVPNAGETAGWIMGRGEGLPRRRIEDFRESLEQWSADQNGGAMVIKGKLIEVGNLAWAGRGLRVECDGETVELIGMSDSDVLAMLSLLGRRVAITIDEAKDQP